MDIVVLKKDMPDFLVKLKNAGVDFVTIDAKDIEDRLCEFADEMDAEFIICPFFVYADLARQILGKFRKPRWIISVDSGIGPDGKNKIKWEKTRLVSQNNNELLISQTNSSIVPLLAR